jgi:hypothetical protein
MARCNWFSPGGTESVPSQSHYLGDFRVSHTLGGQKNQTGSLPYSPGDVLPGHNGLENDPLGR